jgi:hypothetical protein
VQEKQLVITLIVALSLIIILILIMVFSTIGKKSVVEKKVQRSPNEILEKKKVSIEDMLEIVANRKSTKNDLTNAVLKVSKELLFPKKVKGKVPKEAKLYLNFALLLSSHPKADAKLIAFMDYELKKVNKEYSTEIDIYENEGIRQKTNRV